MARENVKEHFSHFLNPRVIRVLVQDGECYIKELEERARRMGIMARDEEDLCFTLDRWRLVAMDLTNEPHEDVMKLDDCKKKIAWLEATLAVAVADKEVNA